MESGNNLECEVDRLSGLPDDLIHKILSNVDLLCSIRLSVLSSRWRFIWTSLPNLNFCLEICCIFLRYPELVNNVLSARNNKIDVSSVSLAPYEVRVQLSGGKILEYAFSHNVQQLSINRDSQFSPSQLSSKSLKHLTIIGTTIDCRSYSPWDLPALTTLHFNYVKLYSCSSILAMCQNLKNLTLEGGCEVVEPKVFTINNPRLLSLTLKGVKWKVDIVNVDTPQLKKLIFVNYVKQRYYNRKPLGEFPGEVTISACDLTCLHIEGTYFSKLSLDEFPSLEKVDLCISSPQETDVDKIRHLFQRLHSVKSLALNLEIVEILSTSEEVISHQPSPFPCLKSLKIYPLDDLEAVNIPSLRTYILKSSLEMLPAQLDQELEAMKLKLSAVVANYLLGISSNATFTMVSHEEARAIKITEVAYSLIVVLWDSLEKIVAQTIRANVERKKPLADSRHEDFSMSIGPLGETEEIFRILNNINVLLTKVLASKRVELQAYFTRLSAKSKTVVNKVLIDIKNQCDIKQHIFNGYFDEIDLSS